MHNTWIPICVFNINVLSQLDLSQGIHPLPCQTILSNFKITSTYNKFILMSMLTNTKLESKKNYWQSEFGSRTSGTRLKKTFFTTTENLVQETNQNLN
jgi:hypothetical protein